MYGHNSPTKLKTVFTSKDTMARDDGADDDHFSVAAAAAALASVLEESLNGLQFFKDNLIRILAKKMYTSKRC